MNLVRSTAPVVLGIDLGTTGAKAVLLDVTARRVRGVALEEYPTRTEPEGAHEQDPADWWAAVVRACRRVVAEHEARPVAIGLSGQMHSLLVLDGSLEPVHPAMTWADRRVGALTAALARDGRFAERTGNAPVDAFTAPKLAWLVQEQPSRMARGRHLLLAKDWVALQLTGRLATDSTDALGTLLWDARRRVWDPELFALCGADAALGVEVLAPSAVRGPLTPQAAAQLGVPAGIPVVAGAGDVSAAAFGGGASAGETLCMNVGTAAQVMGVTPGLQAGPGFIFGAADEQGYICMASVYAAGASVRWFATTHLDGGDVNEAAADSPPGARGLSYLPFMFGATVPRKNDAVRGGFFGERPEHTSADRAAAVLEGVAYACADAVEAVAALSGGARRLHVVGGVTRSRRFREALASALDLEVVRVPDAGSTLGACLLGALGAGLLDSPRQVLDGVPSEPVARPEGHEALREARERFSVLVEQLV